MRPFSFWYNGLWDFMDSFCRYFPIFREPFLKGVCFRLDGCAHCLACCGGVGCDGCGVCLPALGVWGALLRGVGCRVLGWGWCGAWMQGALLRGVGCGGCGVCGVGVWGVWCGLRAGASPRYPAP